MALSREEIFASRGDRRPSPLEVPEWGGTVYLKRLTVDDQIRLSELNDPKQMPVAVVLEAVCDENGNPTFLPEDAAELAKEAFVVVLRVFAEAAKLNGLSTTELDEAMQNFAGARSGPEPTESLSLSTIPDSESATVQS